MKLMKFESKKQDPKIIPLHPEGANSTEYNTAVFVRSLSIDIETTKLIQNIITSIDLTEITSFEDFDDAIHSYSPKGDWFVTKVKDKDIYKLWQNNTKKGTHGSSIIGEIHFVTQNKEDLLGGIFLLRPKDVEIRHKFKFEKFIFETKTKILAQDKIKYQTLIPVAIAEVEDSEIKVNQAPKYISNLNANLAKLGLRVSIHKDAYPKVVLELKKTGVKDIIGYITILREIEQVQPSKWDNYETDSKIRVLNTRTVAGFDYSGFVPDPKLSTEDQFQIMQWFDTKFLDSGLKISGKSNILMKSLPDLLELLNLESGGNFRIKITEANTKKVEIEILLIKNHSGMIMTHRLGTWLFGEIKY